MCRVLIYLGEQETPIYDLLYGPDNSLAHQSYAPQLMRAIQNLAGLGFCAWSRHSYQADSPYFYKTTRMPFYDKNLYHLSKKITTNCFLAHVRGVRYSTQETIADQNVHPFKFDNSPFAFAHNGNLVHMDAMKQAIFSEINREIFAQIKGATDSEWIYALFLTRLAAYHEPATIEEASDALVSTLSILRTARQKLGIAEASPVNLFLTNGQYLLVTRFVYDFGCYKAMTLPFFPEYHSLWATFGEHYGIYDGVYKMHGCSRRNNILIASEPLTCDRTTWIELPEYSLTKAWLENNEIFFRTEDLVV